MTHASPPSFIYTVRVGYADTDRMGFAHHSRYLVYMESARTELLRATGDSYGAMEERGFLLPLIETNVRFLKPALYDDVLHVGTRLTHLTRTRVRFDYEITCPARQATLIHSWTLHAFMNKEGRPVRTPPEEMTRLEKLLSPLAEKD